MRNGPEIPYFGITPKEFLVSYAPTIAAAGLTLYLTWGKYIESSQHGSDRAPWFLAAGAIYILGTVADKISSIRNVNTAARANNLGIKVEVIETNPFLPNSATKRDLLSGRKLAIDAGVGVVGTAIPPGGIAFGVSRLVVAVKNEFIVNRPIRALIEKKINNTGGI